MEQTTLILEIGEVPISELTPVELAAVLAKYSDQQVREAAMKVFDLLRKKYQPNFRMGRMYENLSDKYTYYDKLFKEYASSNNAGRNAAATTGSNSLDIFNES